MMPKLILITLFFLALLSCRNKVSSDYIYYQPYRKDSSALVKKPIIKSDTVTIKSAEINPADLNPVNVDDKYFIVIASFSVRDYALAMKSEMESEGFKPEIIMINNDGWNKLAISSYNNFEEASKALNMIIQKKGRFSDARMVVK